MYRYCTKEDEGLTEGAYCSCTAGTGMKFMHVFFNSHLSMQHNHGLTRTVLCLEKKMMSKIVKAHQEVRDLVLLFQGIPEQIPMQMKMTFCRQSGYEIYACFF
jgi:hypothetical protein